MTMPIDLGQVDWLYVAIRSLWLPAGTLKFKGETVCSARKNEKSRLSETRYRKQRFPGSLRIAKLHAMEYRGIRYTVRARIEREQWYVAIHPAGVENSMRLKSAAISIRTGVASHFAVLTQDYTLTDQIRVVP